MPLLDQSGPQDRREGDGPGAEAAVNGGMDRPLPEANDGIRTRMTDSASQRTDLCTTSAYFGKAPESIYKGGVCPAV